MDKKISLEHAIRNVVRESIGVSGNSKFKGTPKPFLQPAPHIEPKVGDSHPDGLSVTAKRGNAKIQGSETMKEENIEEGKYDPVVKLGAKAVEVGAEYADDAAKAAKEFAKDFWSKIKPAEPEASVPAKIGEKLPAKPEVKTEVKPEVKVETKPEVKTEVKPETKVQTKPEVKTEVKPEVKVETKPEVKPEVKVETKPETKVQTKPETKVQTKPETKVQTQTQTQPKLGGPPPVVPGAPSGGGSGKKRGAFVVPGVHPDILSALQGYVPVKTYMHYASDRATFGEATDADSIRRSIENVARPNSKNKLTKQAEIKNKIIDENANRAAVIKKVIKDKSSTINPNPKLKHPEVDQN